MNNTIENTTDPRGALPRVEFTGGRLECYFAGRPDNNTRATLKARGFWWDGSRGCWWLARPVSLEFVRGEPVTRDGFAYALDGLTLCGVPISAERAAELKRADSDAAHQAGARGIEEACGI